MSTPTDLDRTPSVLDLIAEINLHTGAAKALEDFSDEVLHRLDHNGEGREEIRQRVAEHDEKRRIAMNRLDEVRKGNDE